MRLKQNNCSLLKYAKKTCETSELRLMVMYGEKYCTM